MHRRRRAPCRDERDAAAPARRPAARARLDVDEAAGATIGAAAASAGSEQWRHRTADRAAPGRSAAGARAPSRAAHRRARPRTARRLRRCLRCRAGCATERGSRSSSTTSAAPRDAASKPSAPLPAKASRQRQPVRSWPSQLNSVSRTRSGVGRRPGRSATGSLLRFHAPPMMRTSRGRPARPPRAGVLLARRSAALGRSRPHRDAVARQQRLGLARR